MPESELWSVGTCGVQIQETEDACGNQIVWSLHGHFTTPAKTGPALLSGLIIAGSCRQEKMIETAPPPALTHHVRVSKINYRMTFWSH